MDLQGRVLLFRFRHRAGPLEGAAFWATPGGGLEPGETYEDAAARELAEEVGLTDVPVGSQVARRCATFQLPEGDWVEADERYFLVRVDQLELSTAGWTALEREVMTEHRWWAREELRATTEQVWPENLCEMLAGAGV